MQRKQKLLKEKYQKANIETKNKTESYEKQKQEVYKEL